jgi:S-adenosylmethionine hydrolase
MLTLASDFGSPYPAAMRGVIYRRIPDATVVDLTHELPRQDVRAGAFWLREVVPWFPPAVHCLVVDPGVGTDRDALLVRAGEHGLVGPDNGLLAPIARAIDGSVDWYRLTEVDAKSTTFHGRDVFAPAAARLHDVGVANVGQLEGVEPVENPADLHIPDPQFGDAGATGEVLVVDGFGNLVTNLPGSLVEPATRGAVLVNGDRVTLAPSYAHVAAGERLVTVGSHGNVELAVNRGRADEAFDLDVGAEVSLRKVAEDAPNQTREE